MKIINLFFSLPDEIKTIIWQYDPTYTIVKKELCYYLQRVSLLFYASIERNKGLRSLVAFGTDKDFSQTIVCPSYIKDNIIYIKMLCESRGGKTVKDIIQYNEEDEDSLKLYIKKIHKINRPITEDVSLYVSDEIKLIMDHTGCTITQAINSFKNNDNDIVNAIMDIVNGLDGSY